MANENGYFPKDFIWGAATASYQIEGAANEDGRGESIWDRFSKTPGKVFNGDTGDVAADHYHRWKDDIKLMKELGLHAYRFSIAWPRIIPTGRGRVNEIGLDFYHQLVDGLLEAGIQPFATLYHWDLPQVLQDEGGWAARSTAEAFAEYADIVTRALGDRIVAWATFNEPQVSSRTGYLDGRHAPGHESVDEMLAATHHLLLAHGLALPAMRANAPKAKMGIVLNLQQHEPASSSAADRKLAWLWDGFQNRIFLDPLAGRGYPQDVFDHYQRPTDFIKEGDLDIIAGPIDYLGVNHYHRGVHRSKDMPEAQNSPITNRAGDDRSEMDWEIYPQGLYDILTRVHHDYYFPEYYVTENGVSVPDELSGTGADGKAVNDVRRVNYYRGYISAAGRALASGVPLRGYFAWSLMDNFEWGFGYSKRFGIIYIDYETQERIWKDSAHFYKKVIETNGGALEQA
jgi:beta-glucosidase